ncbi:MAG: peptidase M64 [Bacteroidales bacterium]|nr:peptidase M64 [Bacteroidales bacterium]
MKHILMILIMAAVSSVALAQDQTLRIDYIFSGTDKAQEISLDEMSCFDGWAGRRVNLDKVPVRGNGQISMTDKATGKVIWRQSFSTLFQEWQTTEEATHVRKAFENVFLLPMPSAEAVVEVELYDFRGGVSASLSHNVLPSDILIRRMDPVIPPHRYLHQGGDVNDCIDVAIVAEGYTADEADKFYADAKVAMEAILAHEPFGQYQDRFNFVAVALSSEESGVSVPGKGEWKKTALSSHFNTFYMDRYLTTLRLRQMHDRLCGIPYEHIVILANTDTYGGGGIYNSYTLTTAGHVSFRPVVVHEFGHSFAGLADEYYYDDQFVEYYYPDCEPWEQNITTLFDFTSKWDDMLPKVIGIPTAPVQGNIWESFHEGVGMDSMIGVYEGAGYQSKGVYRPFPDCRMKTNAVESFCPVCQRAIARMIEYHIVSRQAD